MEVKVKKTHELAVINQYAKQGDVGIDLTAVSLDIDENGILTYDTGLAFEIPSGYYGLVTLRSSVYKTDLMLTNHVGIIDSGFRSSIKFKFVLSQQVVDFAKEDPKYEQSLLNGTALFYPTEYSHHWKVSHMAEVYKVGDRIGQIIIMPYPSINLVESDILSDSERGITGFGSTGS